MIDKDIAKITAEVIKEYEAGLLREIGEIERRYRIRKKPKKTALISEAAKEAYLFRISNVKSASGF